MYAAHNSSSLFLAFQVRDQFIDDQTLPSNSPRPFTNDSVELYIDGDLVANDFMRWGIDRYSSRGNREGFQLVSDVCGRQLSVARDITNADWTAATKRTQEGYIIEFEIPLDLIDTEDGAGVTPATTGSFLLMNACVNDNDTRLVATETVGFLWNPDQERCVSLFGTGEDSWLVGLRLTPGD